MRNWFSIRYCLAFLAMLFACEREVVVVEGEDRWECSISLQVPFMDLPSSRSGGTDFNLKDYELWIFNNNQFVGNIGPDSKYTDAKQQLRNVIEYDGSNGGQMKLFLEERYENMRIMMIVNANTEVPLPKPGDSWQKVTEELQTVIFTYAEGMDMPLFGTSGERPINMKTGMRGVIQLKRALARVILNTSRAKDHFMLTGAYIYNVGCKGHLIPVSADKFDTPEERKQINLKQMKDDPCIVMAYLTELHDVSASISGNRNLMTSIILKGHFLESGNNEDKYIRLEFIKHYINEEGVIAYEHITDIERNHCYIFDIEYLLPGTAKSSIEMALTDPPANQIGDVTKAVICREENIMDITTDNYTFLGVTSGFVNAVENTDGNYFVANVSIATNSQNGWKMDKLPKNVRADMTEWKPDFGQDIWTTQSVWIYLLKSSYLESGRKKEEVYIYSDNIRKRIEILLP